MTGRVVASGPEGFAAARAQFATIVGWLDGVASSGLDHAELEGQLDVTGREGACQVVCVSSHLRMGFTGAG